MQEKKIANCIMSSHSFPWLFASLYFVHIRSVINIWKITKNDLEGDSCIIRNQWSFPKWKGNSVDLGNLINHWSMNWGSFKDPCLAGCVITPWSFAQEVAGSNDLLSLNSVKLFWQNSMGLNCMGLPLRIGNKNPWKLISHLLGPIYTKRQRQRCYDTCNSVLNWKQQSPPEWVCNPFYKQTPLFSMRTESQASSHSCRKSLTLTLGVNKP